MFDPVDDFAINNYTLYGNIEEPTAQDDGLVIMGNDATSWTYMLYRTDGSVNLDSPITGSTSTTYSLKLSEQNETSTATDLIPVKKLK